MNCLEFRRRSLAEPGNQEPEFLCHKRKCVRCADFLASVVQFDKRIVDALCVDVPESMNSRVILRQSLYADRTQQTRKRQVYALAASVLLLLGFTGGWFMVNHVPEIDRAVVARVNAVPASVATNQAVSSEALARMLRTLGGKLQGDLGKVSYASIYYVREHQCGQLILAGAEGPVTILLMPGIYTKDRRALRSTKLNGIIVPTASGSMAIVGGRDEALDGIEQRVRSAVTWRL